jgi:hypothetical protein
MSSQTRWLGVVAVAASVAMGVIVWTAYQKRTAEKSTSEAVVDSLIINAVERSMLPATRLAVSKRCVQYLEKPIVLNLRLKCETIERGIKMSHLEVLPGDDGGVIAGDFRTCIEAAVEGLEIGTTHVVDPSTDAGVKLRLPVGREYELEVVLELSFVEAGGYLP